MFSFKELSLHKANTINQALCKGQYIVFDTLLNAHAIIISNQFKIKQTPNLITFYRVAVLSTI